jgi:DNA-binding NtrC family response regulator
VLSASPRLGTEHLPEKMLIVASVATSDQPHAADETTLEGATIALRRRLLNSALQAEGGNRVAAARRLGISRSYLHRLISELGIDGKDEKV